MQTYLTGSGKALSGNARTSALLQDGRARSLLTYRMSTAPWSVHSTHRIAHPHRTLAGGRTSPAAHLEHSHSSSGPAGSAENVTELCEEQYAATFTAQRKVTRCHRFNESALYSELECFFLDRGDTGQLEALGVFLNATKKARLEFRGITGLL